MVVKVVQHGDPDRKRDSRLQPHLPLLAILTATSGIKETDEFYFQYMIFLPLVFSCIIGTSISLSDDKTDDFFFLIHGQVLIPTGRLH